MKVITTLLTLLVCVSLAGAADKDGDKKEDGKSKKEEGGSRSGEGDKPGPRDKAKQQEEMFKQMDTNSDNKVSKAEFTAKQGEKGAAAAGERFDKMDRNKDGELTKREFNTPVYESAGDRAKREREGGKSSEGDKKPGDK